MPAKAAVRIVQPGRAFPMEEVCSRLRDRLQQSADESAILYGDWAPVLDSLAMVSVLVSLEDLFDYPLPPERLVRKGGYRNVDEGVEDMSARFQRLWNERHRPEVPS